MQAAEIFNSVDKHFMYSVLLKDTFRKDIFRNKLHSKMNYLYSDMF